MFWIVAVMLLYQSSKASADVMPWPTGTPYPTADYTQWAIEDCQNPNAWKWRDDCKATNTPQVIPYPGLQWEGCEYPAYPGTLPKCPEEEASVFSPIVGDDYQEPIQDTPTATPKPMIIARPGRNR